MEKESRVRRRRRGKEKEEEEEEEEERRNWAELPRDVLSVIFEKLGAAEVLFAAQAVCRSWWRLSLEPQLWRCVDIRSGILYPFYGASGFERIGRIAVDRSAGQLVKFSVEHFGTDELLQYVSERATQLRCLRLVSCYQISNDGLIEIAKKFPSLEELEISLYSFSEVTLELFARSCPQMKRFRLNYGRYRYSHIEGDEEALVIAKNMPELRELQLLGNKLTNDGLQAILDGCAHLESLDLRQCFHVILEGTLRKRCEKIRDLRWPNDPTDNYPFDPKIFGDCSNYVLGYSSSDDYFGYSEVDLMCGNIYDEYSDGGDILDFLF